MQCPDTFGSGTEGHPGSKTPSASLEARCRNFTAEAFWTGLGRDSGAGFDGGAARELLGPITLKTWFQQPLQCQI